MMFSRIFARAANSVHVLSLGFGAAAVIVQGASLAICYWLIKSELGAGYLGVWALIQTTLFFGRIAEFGLSQSLIHFIPKALEEKDRARAKGYFDTVFVCSAMLFSVLAILLYAPAHQLLQRTLEDLYLLQFEQVFPFAVLAFVIVNVGQTGINALVGLQKAYQGHSIVILAYLLNIIVVYQTVETYGLLALAYGNLATGLVLLILGNAVTSKHFKSIPLWPSGFRRTYVRSLFGVGMGIQSISLFSAVADASVKFFINHYIGIQAVGIYEMANRFILFVRGVFALPQNYLGSYFGGLDKSDPDTLMNAIKKALQLSISLAIIFATLVIITHIWVGEIWVGQESDTFETITLILIIGWVFNVMVSPIYYAFLGLGKLRVPIIAQAIYAGLVFASCYMVGDTYGVTGQVLCMSMSLAVSQIYLFASGLVFAKVNFNTLLSRNLAMMLCLAFAVYLIVPIINETWIADWSTFERFIAFGILTLLHLGIHITISGSVNRLIQNWNE